MEGWRDGEGAAELRLSCPEQTGEKERRCLVGGESPQGRSASATCSGRSSLSQAFCYADLLDLLSKMLMEHVCVRGEDEGGEKTKKTRKKHTDTVHNLVKAVFKEVISVIFWMYRESLYNIISADTTENCNLLLRLLCCCGQMLPCG